MRISDLVANEAREFQSKASPIVNLVQAYGLFVTLGNVGIDSFGETPEAKQELKKLTQRLNVDGKTFANLTPQQIEKNKDNILRHIHQMVHYAVPILKKYLPKDRWDGKQNQIKDLQDKYKAAASSGVSESNNSLATLVKQDQVERQKYQQFVKTKANGDWEQGAKLWAQSTKRSPDDIFGDKQRLNQFAKMKFDFAKFTKDDWNNYWLLAQHIDWNRPFQKQALAIILKHLGKDSKEYKYLSDRIQCGLSGSQSFGTQDICNKD